MIPFRLQIKIFVENPVDVAVFTGIFQNWIQQNKLNEMLIDVADYRHVFQGPGIVLIGHESDYAMDSGAGRLGLLYTRKHQLDASVTDQLRASFFRALTACRLLENAPVLKKKVKFRTDELEVRFVDRLQLPNIPESFDLVREDLNTVLAEIYGGPVDMARLSMDPRQLFAIGVRAAENAGVDALLSHLSIPNK